MSSASVNTTTGVVRSKRRTRKKLPGWSTPERRAHLVSLFNRSKGFCVFGHRMCQNAEHHFLNFQEAIIADWKAQDRAEREALLKIERAQIHGEMGVFGQQFDPVERDVFVANRPDYYLKGLGISPVAALRPRGAGRGEPTLPPIRPTGIVLPQTDCRCGAFLFWHRLSGRASR